MDPIKEAFLKIKEDISSLKEELKKLKEKLNTIQTIPTHNQPIPNQQTNQQTHNQTIPTHNQPIQPSYNKNIPISIRNQGVPTNTQTNKHTNFQI